MDDDCSNVNFYEIHQQTISKVTRLCKSNKSREAAHLLYDKIMFLLHKNQLSSAFELGSRLVEILDTAAVYDDDASLALKCIFATASKAPKIDAAWEAFVSATCKWGKKGRYAAGDPELLLEIARFLMRADAPEKAFDVALGCFHLAAAADLLSAICHEAFSKKSAKDAHLLAVRGILHFLRMKNLKMAFLFLEALSAWPKAERFVAKSDDGSLNVFRSQAAPCVDFCCLLAAACVSSARAALHALCDEFAVSKKKNDAEWVAIKDSLSSIENKFF